VHCRPRRFSSVCAGAENKNALRRRASRSPLAERIERAFTGSQDLPKRATLSIGRGAARVHVILQTTGERATLIAVCRPELRSVVGRALADARLALAARGLRVNPAF
jgi:hypothetical protein